jgi:hypothetical protein
VPKPGARILFSVENDCKSGVAALNPTVMAKPPFTEVEMNSLRLVVFFVAMILFFMWMNFF